MENEFSVEQFQAGYCLSYVLQSDKQAVLIDPHITKVQAYRDYLQANGLSLAAVIDTHTHADHLSAAALVSAEYDCGIVMSANAVWLVGDSCNNVDSHSAARSYRPNVSILRSLRSS